ncbi:sacsin N-terminal ATP-binding-like domain-containing protein [Actinocatenispora rupis]|uniref:Molecular chaperone Hsp90 n=1 Tax=Actinocatenispora rupis TaxID=519421 RepID=A0A8J3JBL4_9ACTN|nr:hypothetical protein [Actinocatenispora rupis]GID13779.1 hypothetical protein Aru02nite_46680 [Actinocatenispora rupis]
MSDPYGTDARRAAILTAWSSSPTRFREDANAEEDLYLGGYADRLLVELAQNAADAATRAGVPGRMRVALVSTSDGAGALSAANTGAPLDTAGVDSLTSLRASAKRDEATVGRFGVGFSAVLAVTDAPELRSTTGGVRFSAGDTRAVVRDVPHLADEVARRDGQVPVLRLPWPAATPPPDGYDSEVYLPLRDAAALAAVRAALAGFDPALLLGLAGLSTVDIDGRVVRRADDGDDVLVTDGDGVVRWRVASAYGDVPGGLMEGRPLEERGRPQWSVTVAVPTRSVTLSDGVIVQQLNNETVEQLDNDTIEQLQSTTEPPAPTAAPVPLTDQFIHAPTPSDEPLGLPVRLIGTFPLDTARRRIPEGPLTDFLVARAAESSADLIASLADTPAVLDLLPRPGFAPAKLSAALRDALSEELRTRAFLPTADGRRVRPSRAVVVPDALVAPLAGVLDGLLPAGWWSVALPPLGVRRLGMPEIVAALTGVERPPAWWRALYEGLAAAPLDVGEREALAALPVPLADGRTVTGPSRVLLPDEVPLPASLGGLGLLVAHADAVHPLLARLGAMPASPSTVLSDDRVRAAVVDSVDAEDPAPVADAVLDLVAAAGPAPGSVPWLADLALPGRALDGTDPGWYPAGELLLPGGRLDGVLAEDAPYGRLDADLDRAAVLAVGVLDTFPVLDEADVDLVDVAGLDLDDAAGWAAAVRELAGDVDPAGLRIERVRAVCDLDLVRDDAWPAALAALSAEPLRTVLAADCLLRTADGERIAVPGYTRWWLSRRPVLGGRRPAECRVGDSELTGLYDEAPGDPDIAVLLGAHRGLADLLAAAAGDPAVAEDLLRRLGDPSRTAVPELLSVVYPRLAQALAGRDIPPPDRVRVAPGTVVDAADAVVLDQPWLLDRLGDRRPVAGGDVPVAVADLLDVPLLSEL